MSSLKSALSCLEIDATELTQKEIDDLEQAIIDSYSGDFYERPYDEDYYRDRD
jgi:hypothetical protein